MKKKKKRLKGFIFVIPTFAAMLLMCILPLLFSLIHASKVNSTFEVLTLILVIIFVITLLFGFLEAVYCMLDVYHNRKIDNNSKIIWYILLFVLNIFLVPYYYYRFIKKDKQLKIKTIIYTLMVLMFSVLSILTTNILLKTYKTVAKEKEIKKRVEQKKKDAVRNIFSSKENNFEMAFKIGFKQSNVSEYDLYAKDEKKNLVTGAFLYDINSFQEKNNEAVLNKQVEFIKSSRKNVDIYKEMSNRKVQNKTIYQIALSGQNEESSECIYVLSAVSFDNNGTNIVYIVQVVLKKDYNKYIKELNDIVETIKLK